MAKDEALRLEDWQIRYGTSTLVRGDGDPTSDPDYAVKQPHIRNLQSDLTDIGFNTNGVDGIYGKDTELTVIQFQENHELAADGKAGTATKSLLYDLWRVH